MEYCDNCDYSIEECICKKEDPDLERDIERDLQSITKEVETHG